MIEKICVAGAGTMGSGIALSAALSNFKVVLFDKNSDVIQRAQQSVNKNLDFLLEKQKITAYQRSVASGNLLFTSSLSDCIADVVIEAIIEDLNAKNELFYSLTELNSDKCIFASNTSSLSISDLQQSHVHKNRIAGMHFFNPAHIMKLVEVVKGEHTSDDVIHTLTSLAEKMGKTPVVCKDSPGFIVNRVARHYYLEAMRLVEAGVCSIEDVDDIMEATGFKMGPFRLMDLIGMDINLSVSQILYNALDKPERLKPSELQVTKVKNGDLGRKTGKGFYNY